MPVAEAERKRRLGQPNCRTLSPRDNGSKSINTAQALAVLGAARAEGDVELLIFGVPFLPAPSALSEGSV